MSVGKLGSTSEIAESATDTSYIMSTRTTRSGKRSIRRAAATVVLTGAVLAGTAGVAAAAQTGDLGPNQGRSFATWFFGRTQVCVKNLDTNVNASYYWVSSTSSRANGLLPGQEICEARSFAGFRIFIQNTSPNASLHVTFPIGP
jgi:hypothetical protein